MTDEPSCIVDDKEWSQDTSYNVMLNQNEIKGWVNPDLIPSPPDRKDPLMPWRLEALKIALEIAFKTCHFDHEYKSRDRFFDHLEQVYEIAERNLKFLHGEK